MLPTSLSWASVDLAGALLPGLALPGALAGVGCRLAGRDLASLWGSCATEPFTSVAVVLASHPTELWLVASGRVMVTGSGMDGQVTVMTPAQVRSTLAPLTLRSVHQSLKSANVNGNCSRTRPYTNCCKGSGWLPGVVIRWERRKLSKAKEFVYPLENTQGTYQKRDIIGQCKEIGLQLTFLKVKSRPDGCQLGQPLLRQCFTINIHYRPFPAFARSSSVRWHICPAQAQAHGV